MQTAIEALLDAESVTGYKPKVIVATRLTSGKKVEAAKDPANPANPTESKADESIQPQANRSRTAISKTIEVKNS